MAKATARVSAVKIAQENFEATMTVKVTRIWALAIRLWLAKHLLQLAGRLICARVNIEVEVDKEA